MRAIYLTKQFTNPDEIRIELCDLPKPKMGAEECLIQVSASGINRSDAGAMLGFFPHAKLPRIPGRDFAGTVVDGKFKGKKVWGTGGGAGIYNDGTHAEFILLPESALAEIPNTLSLVEAGAQTLPYVTAYYGLLRARLKPGESVLVIGAMGHVGHAVMSLCQWKQCKPVALVREKRLKEAKARGWEAVTAVSSEFDLIYNPLGSLFWEESLRHLKKFGRMIVIGAGPDSKVPVQLPLLPFYRANQDIIGINSIDLDFIDNAQLLNEMKPGFESGHLIPINPGLLFPMEKASEAYASVLTQSDQRVTLLIK